ncbi:MAG TPA: Rieske 2Fe-2S domain-containing protein [Polyangiaceae bacterium]|nr:Rieske 2Fe-2S domain-containing protein [Polyangiaceae bacterium]
MLRREVMTVDVSELAPGVHFVGRREVVLWLGEDGRVRAAYNRCRHQGGRFGAAEGCRVRCPWHGWELDVSHMAYTNPTGGTLQPELIVERHGDVVRLLEDVPDAPWQAEPRPLEALQPGELDVTYFTHACMRIRAGGFVLFSDPWLTGPAFTRGWWLSHAPPEDAFEQVARADVIYISHNHSDHLNPATLERLSTLNANVPVIVPEFGVGDITHWVHRYGLRNVRAVPFERWLELAPRLRVMLLRDGTAPGDSGILVEYAGHRILNSVDCSDVNAGVLPQGIDVLMSSFSRGASGFPVCWGELFDRETIDAWIKRDAAHIVRRVCDAVLHTRPRAYLPIASYFVEAHPADASIRSVNVKTSAREMCDAIRRVNPEVLTLEPRPGDCLDLSDLSLTRGPEARPPEWSFERHLAPVEACRHFAPLDSADGILEYFRWSGYRGDLVLHVVETDDTFEPCGQSWLLDLSGPRLLAERPAGPHRYLRIKVRGDVFRHTLRHALPWDEISIGFNARMYREPNAYNRDFWSHFQNCLPATPPWAEAADAGNG